MPEIRYIPAVGAPENAKLPVAAYCRVSSDSDDQLNSLSAQVREYTKQITAEPDWEFAGIYADEGITGTSTKKRNEFKRLMRDCEAGKVKRVQYNRLPAIPSPAFRARRDCVLRERGHRHSQDVQRCYIDYDRRFRAGGIQRPFYQYAVELSEADAGGNVCWKYRTIWLRLEKRNADN